VTDDVIVGVNDIVGVGVALEPGVFDTETVGVTVGDGVAVTD
jgi:hypothetical protein